MINLVKDTKGTEVPKLYAHDSAIFKRIDAGTVRYYGSKGEEIPVTREDILDAIMSSLDCIQKVVNLLPEKVYVEYGTLIEEILNSTKVKVMDIVYYLEIFCGKIEITKCQEHQRSSRILDVKFIETVKGEKS